MRKFKQWLGISAVVCMLGTMAFPAGVLAASTDTEQVQMEEVSEVEIGGADLPESEEKITEAAAAETTEEKSESTTAEKVTASGITINKNQFCIDIEEPSVSASINKAEGSESDTITFKTIGESIRSQIQLISDDTDMENLIGYRLINQDTNQISNLITVDGDTSSIQFNREFIEEYASKYFYKTEVTLEDGTTVEVWTVDIQPIITKVKDTISSTEEDNSWNIDVDLDVSDIDVDAILAQLKENGVDIDALLSSLENRDIDIDDFFADLEDNDIDIDDFFADLEDNDIDIDDFFDGLEDNDIDIDDFFDDLEDNDIDIDDFFDGLGDSDIDIDDFFASLEDGDIDFDSWITDGEETDSTDSSLISGLLNLDIDSLLAQWDEIDFTSWISSLTENNWFQNLFGNQDSAVIED